MLKLIKLGEDGAAILRQNLLTLPDTSPDWAKRHHATMAALCAKHSGIGLAANQVGLAMKLFYVAPRARMPKLKNGGLVINPAWEETDGRKIELEEGCLSLPGKQFRVFRSVAIQATWQNSLGHSFSERLTGLAAYVFQHEYDHLAGVCLDESGTQTYPAR